MNIGILGTGMVGESLGTKFVQLGHQVKMGSRTANNENALKWVKSAGTNASQGTFEQAAAFGQRLLTCLKAAALLEVSKPFGHDSVKGKRIVDVIDPLDLSQG